MRGAARQAQHKASLLQLARIVGHGAGQHLALARHVPQRQQRIGDDATRQILCAILRRVSEVIAAVRARTGGVL